MAKVTVFDDDVTCFVEAIPLGKLEEPMQKVADYERVEGACAFARTIVTRWRCSGYAVRKRPGRNSWAIKTDNGYLEVVRIRPKTPK